MSTTQKRSISRRHYSPSASVTFPLNGLLLPALIMMAAFSGIAIALSIWAAKASNDAGMEARLLQQHVMKLEAELEAMKESANAKRR